MKFWNKMDTFEVFIFYVIFILIPNLFTIGATKLSIPKWSKLR